MIRTTSDQKRVYRHTKIKNNTHMIKPIHSSLCLKFKINNDYMKYNTLLFFIVRFQVINNIIKNFINMFDFKIIIFLINFVK